MALLGQMSCGLVLPNNMKGIILCGGTGTRMRPVTYVTNKHLVPVLNRPMVEYPIRTLSRLGIEDILIVTGGEHLGALAEYLGDGHEFGVSFTYKVQEEAGGIAQALSLAKNFTRGERFAVILGDNFFADKITIQQISSPTIFLKEVKDPNRFGVFDVKKNIIIEKPDQYISNLAVTGLYVYDAEVFDFIKTLKPSTRGELEITSVNNWYLERGKMKIVKLKKFWSDMGTPDSMLRTIHYVVMCEHLGEKAKGRVPWNLGKAWSESVRDKIRKANKGRKYPQNINNKKGSPGAKNGNWNGGISSIENSLRTSRRYEEWRKSVFERDNYECVIGGRAHGNKIVADHIKAFSLFPELRFEVANGRTLCEKCHIETETYGSKSRKPRGLDK